MLEERGGWFVKNMREGNWRRSEAFGTTCSFDSKDAPFPHTGIHVWLLEPGKPNCRYHRENAQEDFLVLSGRCTLLVNGEERALGPWDFVHCPPGVTHVFVGAGDGPCALLAIGHRPQDEEIFYPASKLARRHGAESPEPTPDPGVAYSDVTRSEPCDPPRWPVDQVLPEENQRKDAESR